MQEAIALDGLSEKAEDAVALLKALASPPRLLILCTLLEGERSVGELAAHLEMREATVSQNLTVLRREHIVATLGPPDDGAPQDQGRGDDPQGAKRPGNDVLEHKPHDPHRN